MRWGPIWKTKLAARRAYKGPNKRQKYEYKCSECLAYFPNSKVQVHHVIPVGSFKTLEDLPGFADRLFCEEAGLVVLCLTCHGKSSNH